MSHQIEMKNPRLMEDFRLAKSDPARINEVKVVGTAYDSVLAHDLTYVSTPITSGQIFYDKMKETGKSEAELRADRAFFYSHVIRPNLDNADVAARRILDLKGGAIIAPAAFEAKQLGWNQDEYMGLWFDVNEKKATRIVLLDGWPYSSGGTEEYLQALLMQAGRRDRHNIEICDERGNKINNGNALSLMIQTAEALVRQGHRPTTLAVVISRIIKLTRLVSEEMDYGQSRDQNVRQSRVIHEDFQYTYYPEFRRALGRTNFLTLLFELLPDQEKNEMTNSDQLHPIRNSGGLIRSSERDVLAATAVKVHKPK